MRKVIIALLVIAPFLTFGQAKLTKRRAEDYVDRFAFTKAIDLYEAYLTQVPDDKGSMIDLAHCYVKMNDPEGAVKWYSQSIDVDSVENQHYLHYASMLSEVEKYEESKKWYSKYQESAGTDARSQEHIDGISRLQDFYKDSSLTKVQAFAFNTEETDFAPSYYKNGIVFASSRLVSESPIKHNFSWNMKAFLDLYIYQDGDTAVNSFDDQLNSPYHEGAVSFNEAQSKVFFTRNNYFEKKKGASTKGVNKIQLYEASEGVEGWGQVKEFQFNNSEYSIGDPCFYEPLNALFFASDMDGGFGGTDVYVSFLEEGEWSEPKNLGKKINSEGQDRSPYLLPDGTIFFASDGHAGLGGLDCYSASLNLEDWTVSEVKNLGYPINSSRDDFGLIKERDGAKGYFASNRTGGLGQDDIYLFEMTAKPKVSIVGKVLTRREDQTDSDRIPLKESIVEVWNTDRNVKLGDFVTDFSGQFKFEAEEDANIRILAKKDTIPPAEETYNIEKLAGKHPELTLVTLVPEATVVKIQSTLVDTESKEGLDNTDIYAMQESTGDVKRYKTDENGEFDLVLQPNDSYVLKAMKEGYLTNCATIKTGEASRKPLEIDGQFELEKIAVDKVFEIENVYFDLSKWNIRKDAAVELDKVVSFLKENPSIEVELSSHTDCRGSDAFNLNLSDKRAKSSRDYIVSQGIDPGHIIGKGYGETQLTNKCKNGVSCTEKEHQANRRTELRITGIKTVAKSSDAGAEKDAAIRALDPNADHSDCVVLKTK